MIEGFGFERADLEANRAGHLTDRQIVRVKRELRRRIRILAALLVAGPALVVGAMAVAGLLGPGGLEVSALVALGILYVISLLLIAPLAAVGLYSNYVRPIKKQSVTSKKGTIRLVARDDDVHLQLGSIWNGPRFAIDSDQAAALIDGDTYTVYFTPGGKRSVFHSIDHTPTSPATPGPEV